LLFVCTVCIQLVYKLFIAIVFNIICQGRQMAS